MRRLLFLAGEIARFAEGVPGSAQTDAGHDVPHSVGEQVSGSRGINQPAAAISRTTHCDAED
jgi:hypothetical protein